MSLLSRIGLLPGFPRYREQPAGRVPGKRHKRRVALPPGPTAPSLAPSVGLKEWTLRLLRAFSTASR